MKMLLKCLVKTRTGECLEYLSYQLPLYCAMELA
jgi:hypothetical protein